MPLRVATGFEFGPISTAAGFTKGNSGSRIFDTVGGSPAVNASVARTGNYSLELTPTASVAEFVSWSTATLGTSQNRCFVGFAFQFPSSLPSADVLIAEIQVGNGNTPNLWFRNSDDKLVVSAGGDIGLADIQVGPAVTTGTWYYVELYSDVSAATNRLDWWVNGIQQTQSSTAASATSVSSVFLSSGLTVAMTCRYDDVAIWTDTAAITRPGQHKVVRLIPDTSGATTQIGTANATGRMVNNTTIDATHNSAQILTALSDTPPLLGGTASGVGQRTAGSGNAVGIPMTTYTLAAGEAISGLRILVAGWAASATTNNLGLRVHNGTTEETLFTTADPNFDALDPCAWLVKTPTDANFDTQTELDALQVRLGYATDINPLVGAHAIYAEVAIKEATGAVAPAAVTISATAGTLTVAGTTPTQNIVPAAVTTTATAGTVTLKLAVTPAAVTATATAGTMVVTQTGGPQAIQPASTTTDIFAGELTITSHIAVTGPTVAATIGTVTVAQSHKSFTESFNKADGALGPDQNWVTLLTLGSETLEVVTNQAQYSATSITTDQANIQYPLDYLESADQLVSIEITDIAGTPTGLWAASVGVLARVEVFNDGADFRGYYAEFGRDNVFVPGFDAWHIQLWRLDTSLTPPNNAVLLQSGGGQWSSEVTFPLKVSLLAAGSELTAFVDIPGLTRVTWFSFVDTTYTAGRHVAIQAGVGAFTEGNTFTIRVDNLRATIAQRIEPEPVIVTATAGSISREGGVVASDQFIVPEGVDELDIVDGADLIDPPINVVDAGDTAPIPQDIIYTDNRTIVTADAGILAITSNVAPGAVTITASGGTVTVATGVIGIIPDAATVTVSTGSVELFSMAPLEFIPAPVTVTATPGTLFIGDIIIGPGIPVDIADLPKTVTANDTAKETEVADPDHGLIITSPSHAITP